MSAIERSKQDAVQQPKKLNGDKSPRLDGILPKVLKEIKFRIAQLLNIYTRNIFKKAATIPEDWMAASTVIFSKGAT